MSGNIIKMRFLRGIIILLVVTLLSYCNSMPVRDPAKKGYYLAEKMIQEQRFADGLLLHRINANFFAKYPYGQKSYERLMELNEKLKDSLKNRPKIEVLKQKIVHSNGQSRALITLVNNTELKASNIELSIEVFSSKKQSLRNSITGKYKIIRRVSQALAPWGIAYYGIPVSGFHDAHDVKAQIISFDLKPVPIR